MDDRIKYMTKPCNYIPALMQEKKEENEKHLKEIFRKSLNKKEDDK